MTSRSWARIVCWELAKLAVLTAVVVIAWRSGSSGPRCAIGGRHTPIRISTDGERLLTVTSRQSKPDRYWNGGPLRVWNTRTVEQVAEFLSDDAVHEYDFPDGNRQLFSTADKLHFIDWRAGTVDSSPLPAVWTEKNMNRQYFGDIVVVGNSEEPSDLTILDAATGAILDRLPGRFVTNYQWLVCAGSCLATARYDRDEQPEVVLWDRDARKMAGTLPVRGGPVAISSDGRRIVVEHTRTNYEDPAQCSVWLTDPAVREPLAKLGSVAGEINAYTFSPEGNLLFASTAFDNPGKGVLWSLEPTGKRRIKSIPVSEVTCSAFSDDGRKLAVSTFNGRGRLELAVYDTQDRGRTLWANLWGIDAYGTSLMFTPDGKILKAYVGGPGEVRLFDAATGNILATIDCPSGHGSTNHFHSPDRRFVGVRETGGSETESLVDRVLRALRLKPPAEPLCESWSTLGIADTSTAEVIFRHEGPGEFDIPFLADDGSAVAIPSGDTITVWNVRSRPHIVGMIGFVVICWAVALLLETIVRRRRGQRDDSVDVELAPLPVPQPTSVP